MWAGLFLTCGNESHCGCFMWSHALSEDKLSQRRTRNLLCWVWVSKCWLCHPVTMGLINLLLRERRSRASPSVFSPWRGPSPISEFWSWVLTAHWLTWVPGVQFSPKIWLFSHYLQGASPIHSTFHSIGGPAWVTEFSTKQGDPVLGFDVWFWVHDV
jgi:hypothetical protein